MIILNNINQKPDTVSTSEPYTYSEIDKATVNKQLTVNTNNNSSNSIDIDSTPTVVVGIRVPYEVYSIYKKLETKKKKLLRKIVAATILGLAGKKPTSSEGQNIIFNLNINMANASSNVNIDPEVLRKENKVLREEKKKLKEVVQFYEAEIERLKQDIAELEKRLKEERDAHAKLIGYIRYALIQQKPELMREVLEKALEGE